METNTTSDANGTLEEKNKLKELKIKVAFKDNRSRESAQELNVASRGNNSGQTKWKSPQPPGRWMLDMHRESGWLQYSKGGGKVGRRQVRAADSSALVRTSL